MSASWPNHPLKRIFDILLSLLLLIVLAVPMGVLALLILLFMGRPVLFKQTRPGKDGNLFELIKFRSLKTGEAPDAERRTRFGSVLRRFSLDELPELWNILKGDMSFVGPRPLLPEYLERYSPEQARRHEVKPGLTGWAQVHGRNHLSWEAKFEHDVWYVDHASPFLDGKIIAMTFLQLFVGRGTEIPSEFKGSPSEHS